MDIDWEEVERLVKPSPNFDTLIKNIQTVIQYAFVEKHYKLNMQDIQDYTSKLLGCDSRKRYDKYMENLNSTFSKLGTVNIENIFVFINSVDTKEKFEFFIKKHEFSIEEIIRVLRYLFNWFFPTKSYLRELIEKEDEKQLEYVVSLRKKGIRFTLDILDKCYSKEMRKKCAKETEVPEKFLSELVNKADFTRMPYIRGSSVKHYFKIGFNTLEKLAVADLQELEKKMRIYLETQGVKLSRSFIELDSGILIAGIIPKVVE